MIKTNYSESWMDKYKEKLGAINFTTGDLEGFKTAIREYVKIQNPENINDWQVSSETGLFVNATAYLAENINYRVDLNVNDLFPSTTQRKQSLLNFTKMLSYSAKRNQGANGLAKLISISTTQDITDTLGNELQNIIVEWDDDNNINWREQFLTILNSAFSYTNQFGKPLKTLNINNITTQLYQTTSAVNQSCVYSFSSDINNQPYHFEVVNPDISVYDNAIIEAIPVPEQAFNLIYRNDGTGNASPNTGFFVFWKQGTLQRYEYNFSEKVENNFVSVDVSNISQNDVWFQEIDEETNRVIKKWTKISESEQLSYNNTDTEIRTIYSVETQNNDAIKVKFPDGYFGDIPFGKYKLWFRTTNGSDGIYIKPSDINNVSIVIPYFNNSKTIDENVYYLTLTFSVVDAGHIYQGVPTETIESIRKNAPDIYSTQDRMVSSKDYNYFPKTIGQELKILKAINRTHIGNSRYTPLNDITGTYSNLKILADDGYMYSDDIIVSSETQMLDNDVEDNVEKIYIQYIEEQLTSKEMQNLYFKYYQGDKITDDECFFIPMSINKGQNYMKGYFSYSNGQRLKNINKNDILCLQEVVNFNETAKSIYDDGLVWVSVVEEQDDDGTLIINETLDINKKWRLYLGDDENIYQRIPMMVTTIKSDIKNDILDYLTPKSNNNNSFVITYDNTIISNEYGVNEPIGWIVGHLDTNDDKNGNIIMDVVDDKSVRLFGSYDDYDVQSKNKFCMNWIFKVIYDVDTKSWKFYHRETKNIFGSKNDVSFFFNENNKSLENNGYFISNDTIKAILFDNGKTSEYTLKPYDTILCYDGHTDRQRVVCEGWDGDKDSQMDIPSYYNLITKDKDIIINLNNEDQTTIDFVDLYSPYFDDSIKTENEKGYYTSLWTHTNTSGYYYTYNKMTLYPYIINKKVNESVYKYIPHDINIELSNGTIQNFNFDFDEMVDISKIDISKIDYDFVDYISGYDDNGNPIYMNDKVFDDEGNIIGEKHGYLYYLNINGMIKELIEISDDEYTIHRGKKDITFAWTHFANEDTAIDPCATNIIDMYVLTNNYYNKVQEWIKSGKKINFPKSPSSTELRGVFKTLENNKMISDTIVWHPITYKLLFGYQSDPNTRCIFKVIKKNELITDNEVKKSVIKCIDDFFTTMNVGQSFYFTQLSTYIETSLPNMVMSVIIVPTDTDKTFGELFQISCDDDEILLSAASLSDIQIISSINARNIRINKL